MSDFTQRDLTTDRKFSQQFELLDLKEGEFYYCYPLERYASHFFPVQNSASNMDKKICILLHFTN